MGTLVPARRPRRHVHLPDGYTDALGHIAERIADLDPWNMAANAYTAERDLIILALAKVAAEYG